MEAQLEVPEVEQPTSRRNTTVATAKMIGKVLVVCVIFLCLINVFKCPHELYITGKLSVSKPELSALRAVRNGKTFGAFKMELEIQQCSVLGGILPRWIYENRCKCNAVLVVGPEEPAPTEDPAFIGRGRKPSQHYRPFEITVKA